VSNAKTAAVELIKKLPDDARREDIQHHLFVLEKIKQGQQRLVSEGGISQAVMEDHMAQVRAQLLDLGKVMPKPQAEVFQKARTMLG